MGAIESRRSRLVPLVGWGILVGVIAAVVMGMYAMIAGATYKGSGFFTPLYHIGSVFTDPDAMERSMMEAEAGNLYHFEGGPATIGLGVHMAVGAIWGLVFAAPAGTLRLRGLSAIAVGVVYGFAVMAFMSLVGLPAADSLFDAGEPIAEMPQMAGWETFAVEHGIYGLVLGLWPAMRPESASTRPARRSVHEPVRS